MRARCGWRNGGWVRRRAGRSERPHSYRILTLLFAQHYTDCIADNSFPRICMPRFATDSRPISAQHPITEFYREEFVKHHLCLQQQRPYYSEGAITDVEAALTRILSDLE